MKLGTLLLRNAAIGLSQLEAALRNQVLYGGRLGTNLVELGYIDLELLSAYLAELSGFPIATPTLLDHADPALLEKLGADDAHRLRAIPLGYLGEGARAESIDSAPQQSKERNHLAARVPLAGTGTIAVALVDPTDGRAVEYLGAQLGATITPYIVPELRALYYLEKLFGLPRRARFVRSARSSEGQEGETVERRRTQPGGMAMPPAFTLEPRRRRPSSMAPLAGTVPHAIGYAAACERIDAASNRDQIAETFVAYAQGRCDALVIFLIRDGNALGWRAWVAPPVTLKKPIEELSLPLGGASSLQSAHDAGQPFVGTPPSAARPVEKALWSALGTQPEPFAVLVVPVLVKQRAVNLVYAHITSSPPPAQLVAELGDLASRAQASYLRLIRQARGS